MAQGVSVVRIVVIRYCADKEFEVDARAAIVFDFKHPVPVMLATLLTPTHFLASSVTSNRHFVSPLLGAIFDRFPRQKRLPDEMGTNSAAAIVSS